jgi:hypothetical protein
MHTCKASESVHSLQCMYNVTIAGCEDGNLIFYDNDSGKSIYG